MPTITIASYKEAIAFILNNMSVPVISINNPDIDPPPEIQYIETKLILGFHDTNKINASKKTPPQEQHVAQIIEFANRVDIANAPKLLIHCWAGVARSAAAAYICQAIWMGPRKEIEALASVYEVRRIARPNSLMIEIADRLLERRGALVGALKQCDSAEKYRLKNKSKSH